MLDVCITSASEEVCTRGREGDVCEELDTEKR